MKGREMAALAIVIGGLVAGCACGAGGGLAAAAGASIKGDHTIGTPQREVAAAAPAAGRAPATAEPAGGRVTFVAPDGDDSNPGTEDKPWRTLPYASTESRRPEAGDTLFIKAGTYAHPSFWKIHTHGTAEKPAVFKAYGDGEVRITCSTLLDPDGWTHVKGAVYKHTFEKRPVAVFQNGMPLASQHNQGDAIHKVEDLYPNSFFRSDSALYVWLADGSDPKNSAMRIAPAHVAILDKARHVVLDGLTFEYGFVGIKENTPSADITFRNCTFRSLASHGISMPAPCLVENCRFVKIGATERTCALRGDWIGVTIRNNVFEEISGNAIRQYGDPGAPGPGGEIYGNVFRRPAPFTTRAARDRYAPDVVLWARNNNWVYNNVFYGEGRRPAMVLKEANNRIFNNTFVGCPPAITFAPKSTANWIQNNILVDSGSFFEWPVNAMPQRLDHNLYFSTAGAPRWQAAGATYASFAEFQRASGGGKNSRCENPRLAGAVDARLQPDSPAIDRGAAVAEIAVDKDGIARPQGRGPDMGAYEFRAAK
ncbi:MAG: right-handed parallel beta-helix repeat-containing protein [Kiritimatiellae bacterium]|nr:right-handed parallel beta-helix repeat-containing protein [Kiritimatiellia bacterium]